MSIKQIVFVAIIIFFYSCSRDFSMHTGSMTLTLNSKGRVVKLADRKTGKNYLYQGKDSPLLSARSHGAIIYPVKFNHLTDSTFVLSFIDPAVTISVKYKCNDRYISFEVTGIQPDTAVDLVIWGPYPTTISKTIGETVGVVRDENYAIGIQALNIKTLGGYPTHEDDEEPAYDIFATSDLTDVSDSVKILYRGQTARPEPFGSLLQAYCRDRSRPRVIPVWGYEKYEVPAFNDGGLPGTKIALFGCDPDQVLETIGSIEIAEGLPHPMLDGKWGKTSPEATDSYLIMNFGVDNIDEAISLTQKAGLKYLYHGEPFENWGHFRLNEKEFPDNWQSLKRCVEKAEDTGLHVGVHTLSNFITTNDPYVTPVPDPRLATVGSAILSQDIDENSTEIPVGDTTYFSEMKNNTLHSCVVGDEIIQYEGITAGQPGMLSGCVRGAFGTRIAVHHKGDTISLLTDHPYKTFLGNIQLSEEMATRIANLFNETGLRQLSFDGFEGNWASGMGQYGRQLFVKTWYDHLEPGLKGKIINDASNPGHYFWHIFTRMNWGEPWYAGFRESQTQLRLLNQDYFRRNYIPAMLGWFSMRPGTSLEDIEWLLARAAGFDAGFALVTSPAVVKQNGMGEKILETIKLWESARHRQVFSEKQKAGFRNIHNEYSLVPAPGNQMKLFQYHVQRIKQGTQINNENNINGSEIKFTNPFGDQPVNFIITAGDSANLEAVSLSIDNRNKINLTDVLNKSRALKYTGDSSLKLYDSNWHLIKILPVDPQEFIVSNGEHLIQIYFNKIDHSSSWPSIELRTKNEGDIIQPGNSR